ncbi:site-specific integrase [Clostridium bowmanii]|uniref:site-specific integrase n=1 Tax=Clostridium bowmanii TaxID=132925 RepID=UPI001C0AB90F|nr:site-specific integrase [Clostridium bowmanii]MBU3191849.1 site-specific integrase [Clostridium bowmanii]MCA1076161.1 site-specific integrase [Clostridium bowmanii]
MAIEKLQLQVITNSTDYSNITIGNSKFTDDVWDLSPFITAETLKPNQKKIKFDNINSADLKNTVKLFTYHKLGQIKPQSVWGKIYKSLPAFIKYAEINNITSFSEIDKETFLNFSIWLKEDYIIKTNHNKGANISNNTGYNICIIIEEIIKLGQIKGWNVPKTNIFTDMGSWDLWLSQKTVKDTKTKPIPEEVFDKILYFAFNKETDILTKAGIIIQSQTGLRINEVLSIKNGCIHTTSDGYDYMEVTLGKTEKGEPIIHRVFINELVKSTIGELEKYTEKLRQDSKFKELFISNSKKSGITVSKVGNWSNRLNNFISDWDIRDNKGQLYPLKSHQFRATFVRELIKQKVPIAHIMKQFAHVSIEMTTHYLTLKNEEVKEIYSDIILSPTSKIAGLRAKEIKGKLDEQFRGKTEEEVDDIVSTISKSMSFNPLPTGVCLYDFRRGNCSDGDGCFFYNCPNYITEVKFYPILKQELDLMEKEMTRFKELGRERDWQRQFVKHQYLKPLVDSLEVQMNGKEA